MGTEPELAFQKAAKGHKCDKYRAKNEKEFSDDSRMRYIESVRAI